MPFLSSKHSPLLALPLHLSTIVYMDYFNDIQLEPTSSTLNLQWEKRNQIIIPQSQCRNFTFNFRTKTTVFIMSWRARKHIACYHRDASHFHQWLLVNRPLTIPEYTRIHCLTIPFNENAHLKKSKGFWIWIWCQVITTIPITSSCH